MYIKKAKRVENFSANVHISFCRFNIRILSFGQLLSCASTILSFSELWRHFVWSCDHNPVIVIVITGIVITIRRMQFKLLCSVSPASHYHTVIIGFPSIRGGRCHKKVSKISSMTYIWFHGAYCHSWQMWQCAIKWQSDMCSVKAVIIWIWLEIFIPHSPNFPPKVSWNTLGQ